MSSTLVLLFLITLMNSRSGLALIKDYGERCDNEDDSCSDHRYACLPDEDGLRRCLCDRFHKYGGDLLGCVQYVNTSFLILSSNITITDNEGLLANETEAIVKIHTGAGIFVFVCVIIGIVSVLIFCICAHYGDNVLENEVIKLRHEEFGRRLSSYRTRTSHV